MWRLKGNESSTSLSRRARVRQKRIPAGPYHNISRLPHLPKARKGIRLRVEGWCLTGHQLGEELPRASGHGVQQRFVASTAYVAQHLIHKPLIEYRSLPS